MLINLSNHSAKFWKANQIDIARSEYGEIIDVPFPAIDPSLGSDGVDQLVNDYLRQIIVKFESVNENNRFVHINGEYTFTFKLVKALKYEGICCVAATTKRNVIENGDEKIVKFEFVQFREY
jgi:hypothetical protein